MMPEGIVGEVGLVAVLVAALKNRHPKGAADRLMLAVEALLLVTVRIMGVVRVTDLLRYLAGLMSVLVARSIIRLTFPVLTRHQ